ncbi:CD177 antigen [Choloepus didactylus]|uniref:CD177 antigen n=1 Tax=Choloepus didactylus TaxID=27675 RepID=UPI00189DE0C5|nr:CD177 antigen [Choloepus didactylus]
MLPAGLLVLLGAALSLPRAHALICQRGWRDFMGGVNELPLQWTVSQETCQSSWGCRDTVLLIQNGVQVRVVVSKGCTQAKDVRAHTTLHSVSPHLSIITYNHVCRQENWCNNLNSTSPVWKGPSSPAIPTPAPGRASCPVCLSTGDCPNGPTRPCPKGHCYNGVVRFWGEGITINQRVRDCVSQASCNLLNGTKNIGPLKVSESCNLTDFPICYRGILFDVKSTPGLEAVDWTVHRKEMCDFKEMCQETLLLIDTGDASILVGSKGCIEAQTNKSQTHSIYSGRPGVLAASYTRICFSDGCNNADSSSVLLKALSHSAAPAPGVLQCPTCMKLGSPCSRSEIITCPEGTTHCYSGTVYAEGGGIGAAIGVQGCMAKSSSTLLNRTENIGVFSVAEHLDCDNPEDKCLRQHAVALAPCLTWVVGLGLSLALWCQGLYAPC